jgi:hypothetical protein
VVLVVETQLLHMEPAERAVIDAVLLVNYPVQILQLKIQPQLF